MLRRSGPRTPSRRATRRGAERRAARLCGQQLAGIGVLRSLEDVRHIALLDDQSRRPVMTDPVLRMSQFDAITDDDVVRMIK